MAALLPLLLYQGYFDMHLRLEYRRAQQNA